MRKLLCLIGISVLVGIITPASAQSMSGDHASKSGHRMSPRMMACHRMMERHGTMSRHCQHMMRGMMKHMS